MARRVGRQTKLTPAVQQRICDAIRAGNYLEAAAAYGGVEKSTIYKWLQRGESASAGIFFDFFHAVQAAQAEAEVRIVAQWQQQIPDNWQAARDFLARRFPDRWGPKDRREVEHGGTIGIRREYVGVDVDDV